MSELTWRSGCPGPLEPVGDCALTRLDDGSVHIDQADPRILISDELLVELLHNDSREPHITLERAVLKIHGTNRTVIYRLGKYVPDLHAYYAEWPD